MSSKPAEPRSIASQLVVLFTLAAALLLTCGLGTLYWIVVRHAFEEDNEVLTDRLIAVQAELKTAGGLHVMSEELKVARSGDRATYWMRVLDSTNQVVAESPGMTALLPPQIFPRAENSSSLRPRVTNLRTTGHLFSLLTKAQETGGQTYTIQLAQDRSADDRFMKQFAGLLAAVLALGILASALIAITVTKRGLRPLGEMTRALKRVGPKQLHERVTAVGWPRELQPLAVAFDDMLDRLEDSFTRLSQFSADLAHELRTPIANIRGEAEVALTRSRTADEYREVIESAVAECQRLSHVVDNLLFLARTEAAEGHIHPAPFAGRPAIEKIAEFYEPIAEEQKLTITCTGEGDVLADEMLFGRAVSNLLENALHHTPGGGTILISIAQSPARSEISVRDTGSGIAEEHLPRVFDRFYRADPSRASDGLGLGLALVKSITDLHGGSATITSRIGTGTTVTLAFPNAHP
ncbi:MAG: two-component system, OmpR family, heavy metal sensor histidine kinase CusS [Verrucomicrobiota bacterium]|jgi:two-component system heavy metal sensor histidine kinase CusS